MNRTIAFCVGIYCCLLSFGNAYGQAFVHPGIDQNASDLALMKKKVLAGEEPYAAAYKRLKKVSDTPFTAVPHTHVLRGPYGKPNIGGDDLSRSAAMAYNYALVWYISNDKKYAEKAIAILNAWSPVLWHFDYNDAKLLAAWTGHQLCNAAEILRYNNSGWRKDDVEAFSNMLMTAYYPIFRFYYPQANGNWDGAIIHSIMAIAVFTDNRKMFNNAVDHYLHGPVNGSIFKYIYPNGQCQETMRDQAHVQLGLGEFAGAAQIAFTQGRDLISEGNNRLATGYEFTAGYLLGENPHSYGTISDRAKTLRDDYEYIYRHYTANDISVPFLKKAADSVRNKAHRSILTAVRENYTGSKLSDTTDGPLERGWIAGAELYKPAPFPPDAIIVKPGEPVQSAVDQAAGKDRWVVLQKGIHKLPQTLRLSSGVTLAGQGIESIIFLDPAAAGMRDAIVNAVDDLHDVVIRDLKIEGSTRTDIHSDPNTTRSYRGNYNRGGIIFRALKQGQMNNLQFINLTLVNCTYNGLFVSGGANIAIEGCDLSENGGSVVPGPRLQHNILLTHCNGITISNSRLGTSPFGSGISVDHCNNATISKNEIARNAVYGVQIAESESIRVNSNLIEANDKSAVMVEYLSKGSGDIIVSSNQVQYNGGYGLESYSVRSLKNIGNTYILNREGDVRIKSDKVIVMD